MKLSRQFITASREMCGFDRHIPAPYIRKTFELEMEPEQAEITVCGLGFYELYINGRNITKGPLAPYISNPDDVCYYDRYDLSGLLKKGRNAVGVILGNGFRNAFGGFVWDFDKAHIFDSKFIGIIAKFCDTAFYLIDTENYPRQLYPNE